jgi:hypothetical protein
MYVSQLNIFVALSNVSFTIAHCHRRPHYQRSTWARRHRRPHYQRSTWAERVQFSYGKSGRKTSA